MNIIFNCKIQKCDDRKFCLYLVDFLAKDSSQGVENFLNTTESDINDGIYYAHFDDTDIAADEYDLLESLMSYYNEKSTQLILDFYYKHHYLKKTKDQRLQILKDFTERVVEYYSYEEDRPVQFDKFIQKMTLLTE